MKNSGMGMAPWQKAALEKKRNKDGRDIVKEGNSCLFREI